MNDITILLKQDFFKQHTSMSTTSDLFNLINFGMTYFEKQKEMNGIQKREAVITLVEYVMKGQGDGNNMLSLVDNMIDVIILVSKSKFVINKLYKHKWVRYLCIFG